MSVYSVTDQLCQFLGGPYDAFTKTYRTPQIALTGCSPVVRRAAPRHDDHQSDYWATAVADGLPYGTLIEVFNEEGGDQRVAPGQPGLREVHHRLVINVFIRALREKSEDVQDFQYQLLDVIRAKFYSDRTAGSGGFEAGINPATGDSFGFQFGEDSRGGGSWFRWKMYPIETTERGLSKTYIYLEADAVEFHQS